METLMKGTAYGMVLLIDVGNSNIVIGGHEKEKLVFSSRIATRTEFTSDEYAIKFEEMLRFNGRSSGELEGVAVSNVVIPLSSVLMEAAQRITAKRVFFVEPGIKTGVNIKIDDPSVLGADLVCTAVGAMEKYSAPCVIFDLGTATKITAIDDKRYFLGGAIIPGIKVSLKALSEHTAALPDVGAELLTEKLIGTNTIEAMQAGIIYGTASMIDGMAVRYKEALGGEAVTVVATGGLSKAVIPYCREAIMLDDNLLLEGLYSLYRKNTQ